MRGENMKKCRMISIDSSTKKSAYAVFDNGKYISSELLDCQNKDLEKRFKDMALSLIDSIAKLKPDIIYIEDTVVPRISAPMPIPMGSLAASPSRRGPMPIAPSSCWCGPPTPVVPSPPLTTRRCPTP